VADPDARGAGREHLDKMDAGRSPGGGNAHHADQQGATDNAECHAQCAIDQLRGKTNRDIRRNRSPVDMGKKFNHPNLAGAVAACAMA